MLYLPIFLITAFAITYIVFDGKKSRERNGIKEGKVKTEQKTLEEIQVEELKNTLSDYVYKNKEMKLVASDKKPNAFYVENDKFVITMFDNQKNKTIQIIRTKPYQMITDVVINRQNVFEKQIKVAEQYQSLKYLVQKMVEKMSEINLENINKDYYEYEIKEDLEKIHELIRRMKEYGEYNTRVEEIEKVDLPYLKLKNEKMKTFEMEVGKKKIQQEVLQIRNELEKTWNEFVERKRVEYEKTMQV